MCSTTTTTAEASGVPHAGEPVVALHTGATASGSAECAAVSAVALAIKSLRPESFRGCPIRLTAPLGFARPWSLTSAGLLTAGLLRRPSSFGAPRVRGTPKSFSTPVSVG